MNFASNPLTHALREGTPQIGLWISMADPYATSVTAGAGFDWAVIDCEHAPSGLKDVMNMLAAFAPYQTTPLVRPPSNDEVIIKRLLDLGAPGLVIPMVQSVAEAEAAVAATRYPPRGIRGVAGATPANNFGRTGDYYRRVETELTLILQIETQEAMAHAEDIAAVDGVSGIFFGPADIAADLGHLGQPLSEHVWAEIMPVARSLMARGVPVGTLVTDPDVAARLIRDGFTFVACGTDAGLLARSADALLARMKQQTGKTPK